MKYIKPEVVDYGDLAELTAASGSGGCFDSNYQAGQPIPPEFRSTCPKP